MSYATVSKPTSFNTFHKSRRSRQRGLMIESLLIASFAAFTIVQFLVVIGLKAS